METSLAIFYETFKPRQSNRHCTLRSSTSVVSTSRASFYIIDNLKPLQDIFRNESYILPFDRHLLEWTNNRSTILTSRGLRRLITVYTNNKITSSSRCPTPNITPIRNLIRSRNIRAGHTRASRRSTFIPHLHDGNQEMKTHVWLVPVL